VCECLSEMAPRAFWPVPLSCSTERVYFLGIVSQLTRTIYGWKQPGPEPVSYAILQKQVLDMAIYLTDQCYFSITTLSASIVYLQKFLQWLYEQQRTAIVSFAPPVSGVTGVSAGNGGGVSPIHGQAHAHAHAQQGEPVGRDYDWKYLWLTCMDIAEKMWEDNYIHPTFLRECASRITRRPFDGHTLLTYQRAITYALDFKLNIDPNEFERALAGWTSNIDASLMVTFPEAKRVFRPRPTEDPRVLFQYEAEKAEMARTKMANDMQSKMLVTYIPGVSPPNHTCRACRRSSRVCR